MNTFKYGCGIDMGKDKFDACLGIITLENDFQKVSSLQFENTRAGFNKYMAWIIKHCRQPLSLVHLIEATGIYYENLALHLVVQYQQSVAVVLPNKAKKYKESLGFKSKTDGIDALALSRMACEQSHSKWHAPDPGLYHLRLLTRQIESITAQATAVKNQLEALAHSMYPNKDIEKMLKKQVSFLDKQKAALLHSLEQLIAADADMKQKFDNIKKIKGVSTLTIAIVIAETGGFSLIKNVAQLVSYAGYDVVENQSGKHSGKTKISKQGNGRIRRCLYFPALSVVRYQVAPFIQLYERIFERSKIKMKGYTAVQKKLLVIIYTLWKNKVSFYEKQQHNKTFQELEKAPFLVSASKKQPRKKVASVITEATQDKHPSNYRSMPSLV